MIHVIENIKETPFAWYTSKPRYPLHITVRTRSNYTGSVTGMEQSFLGDSLSWKYQLTSVDSGAVVSSWWSEEDILEPVGDTFIATEYKEDQDVGVRYLETLEQVCQYVKRYGELAVSDYHQAGKKKEIQIRFWDACEEDPDADDCPY